MKNKFALIFLIACPLNTYALNIVTTITPIASLIKMLTKNHAEVSSILSQNICPHHYQSTFADYFKVKNADIVLFVDKELDSFAYKLMNSHKNLIEISQLSNLTLIKSKDNINGHLWLNLDNAKILLSHFAEIIIKKSPELKETIQQNLKLSLEKIDSLILLKKDYFAKLDNIILASDSLEYLFLNEQTKIIKAFEFDHKSPKYLYFLQNLHKEQSKQCILLSNEQNTKIYQKFKLKFLSLDSENWEKDNDLEGLYEKKYLELIKIIGTNCIF